ncbi:alpha/beta fold hydrolase [Kibdelosporangium philippinense]|uniref:Alpha/beta fold hydrolase n=1 Tax=Kibdelosporangium philippinense TaxID=211113 RepID=A0ABS8ZWR2_9PSEU|nr:alpha/beta fold hydrolase [Kibdelosporangium philippinense]MCE7012136.1 alpha/beta fold hydrolase [Kibdelosporangium philippinense]
MGITVFIVPGLALAPAEWWPLRDRIGEFADVIVWERQATAIKAIVDEAVDRLKSVDGPIVLVGHSQGGLYVDAIARVITPSGMVLLDPVHPRNDRLWAELPAKLFRNSGSDIGMRMRTARFFTRLKLGGLFKSALLKNYQGHPAVDSIWQYVNRVEVYDNALAEYERNIPCDLDEFGPFPDIHVVNLVHDPGVLIGQFRLSAEDGQRVETLWSELLRDHPGTEVVEGAGHLIHIDRPDAVLHAVKRVCDLVG